jgi:SAM-dependent methyltransferase
MFKSIVRKVVRKIARGRSPNTASVAGQPSKPKLKVWDDAELYAALPNGCHACGSKEFAHAEVLWQSLIDEWQLGAEEIAYINRQQGFHCQDCGASLRGMVLARAICSEMDSNGTLAAWTARSDDGAAAILEINEAERLTAILSRSPGHRIVTYPEVDMHDLPFKDDSFDLVVHSDTLEHVENPIHALAECRRVLRPGGVLAFTVPVIVGRLTRSRDGPPPSYHGSSTGNEYLVRSESALISGRCYQEPALLRSRSTAPCILLGLPLPRANDGFTASPLGDAKPRSDRPIEPRVARLEERALSRKRSSGEPPGGVGCLHA